MEEKEKTSTITDAEELEVVENETSDEEEPIEKESTSETKTVEQLIQENELLLGENEKLSERLLRVQAEFDNYRKRTEKERIAERKYQAQELAIELLPTIDNFERALQTEVTEENKGFHEGIQMVYNQFIEALKSQGIETIDVLEKEFDPNLHHAVMQVEDETVQSNIVTEELQKGFMLKDKVIRPAMVKVNK